MRRRQQKRIELLQTRRAAERERKQYGLCECGDETKTYDSQEEADADQSPPIRCECGKDKLRIKMIRTPGVEVSASDVIKHVAR